MRNNHPFSFYIAYHSGMSLLIAFIIAFFMLHPYSMNETGLNFFQQIWLTLSYLFTAWSFLILMGAGVLGLFSFGIYGFLRGMRYEQESAYTAVYILALLLSFSMFSVFGGMFNIFGVFTLIPSIVQCAILAFIETRWLRPSRKSKRGL
jgi:hypothetical protein